MPSDRLRFLSAASVLAGVLVLVAGCDKSHGPVGLLLRPTVELTAAPAKGDSVHSVVNLEWIGADADGYVTGYQYAVDPPAMPGPGRDTAWVDTPRTGVELRLPATRPPEPLPPPGSPLAASDYHTVVLRAIDNDGLRSIPVARSFTAYTVAPFTHIVFPDGSSQLALSTPPESLRVAWVGNDPDGSRGPVAYKVRLARAEEIHPADPGGVTMAHVQAFFGADAPRFEAAGWDSLPGDSTTRTLRGLSPGVRYFFAVVAIDESGAYEPRFSLDSNVLQFMPTVDLLGPRITVFNEFFSRTQNVGGVSLSPTRIFRIEYPSNTPLTIHWVGLATQPGVGIDAYRWALDIEDILDETPRSGPDDLAHWSPWSDETSATIGPFQGSEAHHFYIEARDDFGFISLFTLAIAVVEATDDRPLLLVDDLYGPPTMLVNFDDPRGIHGDVRLAGSYPLEAEQDSFHVARGGFPDSLYLRSGHPGVVSLPGAFADFAPDTLDYRFYPVDGIPLSELARYQAVAWYTDRASASRSGGKFGSLNPMTAIRAINMVNRLNTLAVYARLGGSVFLFGEGTTTAIANGYYTRYGSTPRTPYTSGDDPVENVLYPGNFLYDFCHLRSELSPAGSAPGTELVGCLPFLPAFFPLEPGAARTAQRWPDLPRLTVAAYRGAPASPGVGFTWVLHAPNTITGPGPAFEPEMDTLYVYQARTPDPGHVFAPYDTDGYPNAVHYHGPDNGPGSQLVWLGFPLHFFEREQARAIVRAVMRNFGIQPQAAQGRVAGRR
jgi:hypothetical protein